MSTWQTLFVRLFLISWFSRYVLFSIQEFTLGLSLSTQGKPPGIVYPGELDRVYCLLEVYWLYHTRNWCWTVCHVIITVTKLVSSRWLEISLTCSFSQFLFLIEPCSSNAKKNRTWLIFCQPSLLRSRFCYWRSVAWHPKKRLRRRLLSTWPDARSILHIAVSGSFIFTSMVLS